MDAPDDLLALLKAAVAFGNTALIVRSPGAITEIVAGLTLRADEQWITIGDEGASHVHLRRSDLRECRFVADANANAALELLGHDGVLICKLSFRSTNAASPARFDRERTQAIVACFARLASPLHTTSC